MKKIICVLVMMMWSVGSWATPQIPDVLTYKGEIYNVVISPSNDHFFITKLFEKFPDKRLNYSLQTTALWRIYVSTFEVENDILYLTDVTIDEGKKFKSVFREMFPDGEKVKADWITGIVHVGRHETSVFEYKDNCLFEVEKGNIADVKILGRSDLKKLKKQQVKLFVESEYYDDWVQEEVQRQTSMNKYMLEITPKTIAYLKNNLQQIEAINTPLTKKEKAEIKELRERIEKEEKYMELYKLEVEPPNIKQAKVQLKTCIFDYLPKFLTD